MGIDAPQRVEGEVMDALTADAADWIGKQSAAKPFFL
jgi:hypothetical protein